MKREDGSLNAYCAKCEHCLDATNVELKELAASGELRTLDLLCEKCTTKFNAETQLGEKEYGVA